MRIKKYRAASLPDALRAVKRDLGADAVIVHSQRVQRGGVLGFFGQDAVEVVAAIDSAAPVANHDAAARRRGDAAIPECDDPSRDRPRPSRLEERSFSLSPGERVRVWAKAAPCAEPSERAPFALTPALSPGRGEKAESSPGPAYSASADARDGMDPGTSALLREIGDLKAALTRVHCDTNDAGITKLAPSLVRLYRTLVEQELDPALARDLVTAVDRELSDHALADPRAIDDSLRRHLQRRVPVTGPIQPRRGEPLVLFVVGPTGVGKTTTLAKLAATYTFERQRVTLVTTDTFRVAAIPQLQTYAEILDLPVAVAYTPADLGKLVAQNARQDVILVDTPGRSQHQEARLAELGAFVRAVPRATVLLAQSAATRYRDMRDVVARFSVIPYDGLLVTKLDETATFGPIVNLVQESGKPLTYLTTGQNVPADLEVATSERLAWLIAEDRDV